MELFEYVVHENMDKGEQLRLTVSDFRDVEYLHLRKYFLSYEGDWVPSKEGASMPLSLDNAFKLLDGLVKILSEAESIDAITGYFERKLSELNQKPL